MPKNLASRLNGSDSGRGMTMSSVVRNCFSATSKAARSRSSSRSGDAGFDVILGVEAVDAALQEEVADTLASVGELRQLVGDALQQPFEVVARVRGERLLQVLADAVVVDDVADVLARGGAVDARDRLQQLRLLDRAVQVEDLLDRGVEAGQQHRLHDQERDRGDLPGSSPDTTAERQLEGGDVGLVLVAIGPLQPVRIVVVAARDDRHEVQRLDEREMRRGTHEARRLGRQLVSAVDRLGRRACAGSSALDLGHQLVAGAQERVPVADRRQAGWSRRPGP